jgi:hypothetical protein
MRFFQFLFKLLQLRLDHYLAVAFVRIIIVIVLMLILGHVKFLQRHNLRDDRVLEFFLRVSFGLFGRGFLGVILVKNYRTILCSRVGSLPIQSRRVMRIPKIVQQFFVGNFLRVIFDLRDFRVAGGAGADVMIGGVLRLAARETAGDVFHARDLLELRFHAPKTAAAKRGGFRVIRVHSL